jgi:hypothetical protein
MELMIVACFYVASVYGKVIFKNAAITMAVVVSTLVSIGSSFKFDSDLKEERLRLENLADKNPKIMGLKAMVENEQLLFNDLSETYNNPDSEKYHK